MPMTPPTSGSDPEEAPSGLRGALGLGPRDQMVLYVLAVAAVVAVGARYAAALWPAGHPVRRLRSGEAIDYCVDINRAGPAELDLLPGIGPARAAAIVADRAANGPFRCADDLARVRGIGAAAVAKIRHLVTVGPSAAPGGSPE